MNPNPSNGERRGCSLQRMVRRLVSAIFPNIDETVALIRACEFGKPELQILPPLLIGLLKTGNLVKKLMLHFEIARLRFEGCLLGVQFECLGVWLMCRSWFRHKCNVVCGVKTPNESSSPTRADSERGAQDR